MSTAPHPHVWSARLYCMGPVGVHHPAIPHTQNLLIRNIFRWNAIVFIFIHFRHFCDLANPFESASDSCQHLHRLCCIWFWKHVINTCMRCTWHHVQASACSSVPVSLGNNRWHPFKASRTSMLRTAKGTLKMNRWFADWSAESRSWRPSCTAANSRKLFGVGRVLSWAYCVHDFKNASRTTICSHATTLHCSPQQPFH